jgi:hypothetical protein
VIHLVHSTTNLNLGISKPLENENALSQNPSSDQEAVDNELTPISSSSSSLNSSIASSPVNISNLSGSYSIPTSPQINISSSQNVDAFDSIAGATSKEEYNRIYSNLKRYYCSISMAVN